MSDLYEFGRLREYLIQKGHSIGTGNGYKIIREDFNVAYEEGRISLDDEGIFILDENGLKRQGYMFQHSYLVQKFGYPKFHIYECQTIKDFINKGLFGQRYQFSTADLNDITERSTGEVYNNVSLNMCGYCRRMLRDEQNGINSSEDFYEYLGGSENFVPANTEVDMFGYTKEWPKISELYRKLRNYTCEICNIKLEGFDKWYLEVHHIDGNKLDNRDRNLKCLCIKCHSNIDTVHRENYKSKSNIKRLYKFEELLKNK